MSIRISKNIDDNSIKYSNGLQSMEALIGSMVSSINEPLVAWSPQLTNR